LSSVMYRYIREISAWHGVARHGGGMQVSRKDCYQIVQAAPNRDAARAERIQTSCRENVSSHDSARTPFAEGGKVVVNAFIGFGPPDTVTVGTAGSGDAWEAFAGMDAPAARIVKREEVAYMKPCVELRKRMK